MTLANPCRCLIILLLAAGLVSQMAVVASADSLALSLEDLANIFSTYFPKIEGSLTKVEEGKGWITLGERNGLVKGVVLEIIRQGAPFYHPVTHEEMGRFEEKIGFLEVESLQETVSAGTLLYKGKSPEPGDRVRISSARISVRVSGEAEKRNLVIMDEFSRLLLETDRFILPSFSSGTPNARSGGGGNDPIYEFRVEFLPDQSIGIQLINLPFQHPVERLVGATNGILQ